jgi:plastocyanin
VSAIADEIRAPLIIRHRFLTVKGAAMGRTLRILFVLVGILISAFVIVGTTRASDEPQIIRVTMKDYHIDLSRYSFVPGKVVEFQVSNEGSTPHRFLVERYDGADTTNEAKAPVIGTGTLQTIQQTFTPGVYRVICDRWDHAARGMIGTFIVDTPSHDTVPVPINFVVPLLGLVLGSAYLILDSLGVPMFWANKGP